MLCRKICEHLHRLLNMFELLHDCDETEASFSPVHLLTASEYSRGLSPLPECLLQNRLVRIAPDSVQDDSGQPVRKFFCSVPLKPWITAATDPLIFDASTTSTTGASSSEAKWAVLASSLRPRRRRAPSHPQ